jgi:hypothetical protein
VNVRQWDRLMCLAQFLAKIREERVYVSGYWSARNGWAYVIECPTWCHAPADHGNHLHSERRAARP